MPTKCTSILRIKNAGELFVECYNARRGASAKRSGDRFSSYKQAVSAYEDRGLSRELALRQAAIDYPALHKSWKAKNGELHKRSVSESRSR